MTKLSDAQLVILSAACQRPDLSVYPLTTNLPGGAVAKVLTSLLNKHLLKEVDAKRCDTLWREDKKRGRLTLKAATAAFEALGIEPHGSTASSGEPAGTRATMNSRRKAKAQRMKDAEPRSRADSKQAQLIAMLKGADGATIEEIVEALEWQPHSVRGFLSAVVKKKLALNVTSDKIEGRGRAYKIAG